MVWMEIVNKNKNKCMHEPSYGYATCIVRKEYIDNKIHRGLQGDARVITLNASENDTNKLYFWQLYSILGEENITNLIREFYKRIFDETEDRLFVETFKKFGDIEYHIKGQTNFWLDIMGGGKRYPGGEFKLKRHHGLAKHIMNEKGAKRWLFHMKKTLENVTEEFTEDKRVLPCIIDFINFFMEKYGNEFNFRSKL